MKEDILKKKRVREMARKQFGEEMVTTMNGGTVVINCEVMMLNS